MERRLYYDVNYAHAGLIHETGLSRASDVPRRGVIPHHTWCVASIVSKVDGAGLGCGPTVVRRILVLFFCEERPGILSGNPGTAGYRVGIMS